MADLNPPTHFPMKDHAMDEAYVARIFVPNRAIVAVLDGLRIGDRSIQLLELAVWEILGNLAGQAEDGFLESPCFVDDMLKDGGRLPLAAKLLEWHHACEENPELLRRPVSDGHQAEVEELMFGPLPGWSVTGRQRDAIVRHARRSLADLEGSAEEHGELIAELHLILDDTGRKKKTGKPCTISSLPAPRLLEWFSRWTGDCLGKYSDWQHRRVIEGGKGAAGEKGKWGRRLRLMRDELQRPLRVALGDPSTRGEGVRA